MPNRIGLKPGDKEPAVRMIDMQIKLPASLRRAAPNEWRQLGDIMGEAFADDPVNRWLFRKPAAITSTFTILARAIYSRQGQCYFAGDDGASMWMPPGIEATPSNSSILRFMLSQIRHGTPGAIKRGMVAGKLMEQWHPQEPHMYLFSIGTRRSARGKGIGKALIAPVLAACDRAGFPVYLENSNPANTGFYRAHGFERMGLFEVGEGGPVMEPMWREPRSRAL